VLEETNGCSKFEYTLESLDESRSWTYPERLMDVHKVSSRKPLAQDPHVVCKDLDQATALLRKISISECNSLLEYCSVILVSLAATATASEVPIMSDRTKEKAGPNSSFSYRECSTSSVKLLE